MPTQDGTKIKIAVVDDEKLLLNVFSSLMKQYDYHADFFSNPEKALDKIMDDPARYNLVLTDILMPQMNGITFAKRIRAIIPKLPIMFMTGDVSEELRDQALALGNVAFLEKPFPLEETLREAIPKFLSGNS